MSQWDASAWVDARGVFPLTGSGAVEPRRLSDEIYHFTENGIIPTDGQLVMLGIKAEDLEAQVAELQRQVDLLREGKVNAPSIKLLKDRNKELARYKETLRKVCDDRSGLAAQNELLRFQFEKTKMALAEAWKLPEKWRGYNVKNMIKLSDSVVLRDTNQAIKNTIKLCADELEAALGDESTRKEEKEAEP